MWHTVFIKNEDLILYESEKAVKIKIPLKGAHYIWLPKKLVKFEKFRHEYMTKLLIPDDFKLKGDIEYSVEEVLEYFSKNCVVDPLQTYVPEKKKAVNITADEELIDN